MSGIKFSKLVSTVSGNSVDVEDIIDVVKMRTINESTGLPIALDDKVDKVLGYSLVTVDEIAKLSTVEQDAQKNTVNSVAGKQGDVLLDKSDVGLSAVDNTSDADKPASAAVVAALTSKVDKVAGKQLSDENYTTADKDKLRDIADGETYLYVLGEYSAGLVVSKPNQIVKFGKVMYLVDEDEPLPYTIIGDDIRDEPLIPLLGSEHSVISWHGQTVQNSLTIPDNVNAWSVGPTMTISDGETITIGENAHWTIS